jgi:hypothetical protein
MYEVKTKKDVEAVEKNLVYNTIQGGSFSAWCHVNKSRFPMYLVIVPRKHTLTESYTKVSSVNHVHTKLQNLMRSLLLVRPDEVSPCNS